jgi:ADP-ribose pyrophosphatase YjhB (NUDIX family)
VRNNDSLLLIERRRAPFGLAPPAGHVDNHGSWEDAARAELREEVGLSTRSLNLIYEGRKNNPCRRIGGDWHYWKIYNVEALGALKPSYDETKGARWYSFQEIRELADRTARYLAHEIADDAWQSNPGIEPVWRELFIELGIL